MNLTDSPKKQAVPFAVNGQRENLLPTTPAGDNTASYSAGFPPVTMILKAAGGLPPKGQDMNQILFELASVARWCGAGGSYPFDSAFAATVSGYPAGAEVLTSDASGFWVNTVDGNSNSPEAADASLTGWVPSGNYGVTALTALTNTSVTLTSLQASKPRITLAGTLTANINLIVPAWQKSWLIENNTSGNFTVTVKTPSGSGVAIPSGAKASVYGNGTNIALDNQTINISTQLAGIVGSSRNLAMNVTSASATATVTADEIIVESSLGGSQYRIGSFSKTINLATTGAGGMDTGTVPANGFVGIYAIYNPTTNTSALLAVNASAQIGEVYGGSNMPSGYTASALLTVVPTASSQFKVITVSGRYVYTTANIIISTSSNVSLLQVSISSVAPLNAKGIEGLIALGSTTSGPLSVSLSSGTSSQGIKQFGAYSPGSTVSTGFSTMPVSIPGYIYLSTSNATSGTGSFVIYCSGYTI